MPKILIYSAVYGDKDDAPEVINRQLYPSELDFVCVTDNPKLTSSVYTIINIPSKYSDTAKDSKYVKICGPPEFSNYDVAIWHDASIILDCSKIPELIEFAKSYPLSNFIHGERSIYAEGRRCIMMRKDSPIKITIQLLFYSLWLKHPLNEKVYENGILVIDVKSYHGTALQKIWWNHVRFLSRRDQLALPVVRRLTGSKFGVLNGGGFNNPYSKYRDHKSNSYQSSSIVHKLNGSLLSKLGLWVIFRIEKHLSKK